MPEIDIVGLSSSGEGVGSLDGLRVFLPGGLPGERVRARLHSQKKTFARGTIDFVLRTSPNRVAPSCPLFGRCGGCQLMHLSDAGQLAFKSERVADALRRIGHLTVPVLPCRPSPQTLAYRNKIQLAIEVAKEAVMIGFCAPNSHQIVALDACAIHCPLGERVLARILPILKECRLGILRHLVIRSSESFGEVLLILVTTQEGQLQELARNLQHADPAIQGVVQHVLSPCGQKERWRTLWGRDFLHEKLAGLTFRVPAPSFLQVNLAQAAQIYAHALEVATLSAGHRVWDLYCGVGCLSLLAAARGADVWGIETVPQAVESARHNADLNRLRASFQAGACEDLLPTLSRADIAFVNPPRVGCDGAVLSHLISEKIRRLVYISCDPATLARDLAVLVRGGYRIDQVQPFDLFPQTAHVEVVCQLSISD